MELNKKNEVEGRKQGRLSWGRRRADRADGHEELTEMPD
jgi:hypothetical protein